MSQIPYNQPAPQPFYPTPRRTNPAAIASLIFGLLGCIPLLSGLLAIIFGIVGILKSREPEIGGRGLAVAGLVLGVLSFAGWGIFGGAMGVGYLQCRPAIAVTRQFVQDLADNKPAAAAANADASLAGKVHDDASRINGYGAYQSISFSAFKFDVSNGQSTVHLDGVATFGTRAKNCTFDLTKTGQSFKITGYSIE